MPAASYDFSLYTNETFCDDFTVYDDDEGTRRTRLTGFGVIWKFFTNRDGILIHTASTTNGQIVLTEPSVISVTIPLISLIAFKPYKRFFHMLDLLPPGTDPFPLIKGFGKVDLD